MARMTWSDAFFDAIEDQENPERNTGSFFNAYDLAFLNEEIPLNICEQIFFEYYRVAISEDCKKCKAHMKKFIDDLEKIYKK